MNNPADLALLDTNVLIYADQRKNKYHQAAITLRDQGQSGALPICITPQVLSEFFAFMTRRDGRGLEEPLASEDAGEEVRKYLDSEHITLIYPIPTTWPLILDSFLPQQPVTGQDIHDLHIAATMLSNGITKIYTFNVKDFEPILGIEVLNPSEIDFTT